MIRGENEMMDTNRINMDELDKDTMFNLYMGGRAICSECGDQIFM